MAGKGDSEEERSIEPLSEDAGKDAPAAQEK